MLWCGVSVLPCSVVNIVRQCFRALEKLGGLNSARVRPRELNHMHHSLHPIDGLLFSTHLIVMLISMQSDRDFASLGGLSSNELPLPAAWRRA